MLGRPYLDTMHADRANLMMRYLLIRWTNLEIGNTVAIVRTCPLLIEHGAYRPRLVGVRLFCFVRHLHIFIYCCLT